MNAEEWLPVLRARPCDLASHALVVGDPERALEIAQRLDHAEEVGSYREYRTFTGEYCGKRISVASHGVGAGGACVCFEELFRAGVRVALRAGTCAALTEDIADGDLVISTAAIRQDGTTAALVSLAFPAVADWRVVDTLQATAQAHGVQVHAGITLTDATLYPGLLPTSLPLWAKAGALCVDMEMAALFVMASLHGAWAGGIMTSDRNLAHALKVGGDLAASPYEPHREVVARGVQTMITIALEALCRLP